MIDFGLISHLQFREENEFYVSEYLVQTVLTENSAKHKNWLCIIN